MFRRRISTLKFAVRIFIHVFIIIHLQRNTIIKYIFYINAVPLISLLDFGSKKETRISFGSLCVSGIRESNPPLELGKLAYYRCTNPALLSYYTTGITECNYRCSLKSLLI